MLADLIERDRIIVDDRLLQFRKHADSTIARERSESATPDGSVAYERQVADEGKKIEREFTDALLERERRRADAVVETEIQRHDAHVAAHEARRQDMDDQPSVERSHADTSVTALAETQIALTDARTANVTERKRAESALQETECQLRHAQKMEAVGMLAGGIAHDFNNILSVILSYGDLVLSDLKPDEPIRADLEEIRKAALRSSMHRSLRDQTAICDARDRTDTNRRAREP